MDYMQEDARPSPVYALSVSYVGVKHVEVLPDRTEVTYDLPSVARVVVVDEDLSIKLDRYILQERPITTYFSKYSGLCSSDFRSVATKSVVRDEVLRLIRDCTYLVGFYVRSDLDALGIGRDEVISLLDLAMVPELRPLTTTVGQLFLSLQTFFEYRLPLFRYSRTARNARFDARGIMTIYLGYEARYQSHLYI